LVKGWARRAGTPFPTSRGSSSTRRPRTRSRDCATASTRPRSTSRTKPAIPGA